jgi:hypothetical protein
MYVTPGLVIFLNLVLETSVVLHFENDKPFHSTVVWCFEIQGFVGCD